VPLLQIIITLIVVGVLLWLINLIPMAPSISTILNVVVTIFVVVWLLQVFGLWGYVTHFRTPGT
jgi:hypothetical protein